MKYFKLHFLTSPAEEGAGWRTRAFKQCRHCGVNSIAYRSEFPVPEDTVENGDIDFWEYSDAPLVHAARLLLGRTDFIRELEAKQLTGFEIESINFGYLVETASLSPLPDYQWIVITGRGFSNDVWNRIVSVCNRCERPKTEPIYNPIRNIVLTKPLPKADIFRLRDTASGIMISQRFLDLIESTWPEYESYLKVTAVETEDGTF